MKKIYSIPKLRLIKLELAHFITAASTYNYDDKVTGGTELWPPQMGDDE